MGSRTKASFEAARLVRSKRMSDEEVYALIKLSRSVGNPVRFRIHRILKSAVKFRGTMHWPLTGRPLPVLPLSQISFIREGDLCDEQRAAHVQALEESDRLTCPKSKKSKPSYSINLFFTMRIIIPTI